MADSKNTSIWTPANIVTMVRICAIPVFVVALISPWPEWLSYPEEASLIKPWIAAILFIVLALTDTLDGYLARSRNEVTTFGKLIDPLADKMLVAAALIALVELGVLPSWVVLVILAREFIVSGIRMIAATEGFVIAASMYGKVKTVLQMVAIVMFIIKDALRPVMDVATWNILYWVSWAVMIAAVVMTIFSLCDYLYKARSLFGFGDGDLEQPSSEAVSFENKSHDVHALAQSVIEKARECGFTIATAESLTGGLIAGALTSVSGSSAVVRGGVVSYTNDVKHSVLSVDEHTLASDGAVSEQTVLQMAEHARELMNATYAISVSGIAGPLSDESGVPVGTVWMGLATAEGASASVFHFEGNRDQIRMKTVEAALRTLLTEMNVHLQ